MFESNVIKELEGRLLQYSYSTNLTLLTNPLSSSNIRCYPLTSHLSKMRCSNLLQISLTLFLSAHRVLGQAIIPYKDGQCTQPVTNYTLNGNTEPASIWDNSNGWPKVSRYSSPTFPGAEAKSGTGYDVYWKIGDPGPGCRVAIMTPYSQSSYGSLGFPAPPGNVVLMAKKAGCYFSSIPSGSDISSTFCCGIGDCKYLSVGNSALLKRADEKDDASISLFSRESAATANSIVCHSFPTPIDATPD